MLVVLVRSIILYISVLIALRVMGKSEIAEMTPFDLVITLLISEVAAVPMQNNEIPLLYGIASITGLVLIESLISFIISKSRLANNFISGNPVILINKGKIDYKQLKKERVIIDELLESLRGQGYFSLKEVQYAILESDGDLSVVPSPSYTPDKPKDFKHLPLAVIIDGKVVKDNLNKVNKDDKWLSQILKSNHVQDIKEILILMVDEDDNVIIQRKKE